MRKLVLFTAILTFIAVFFLAGGLKFSTVSAQNNDTVKDNSDSQLAALIRHLTDRPTENLVQKRGPGDSVSLDLGEGFQNVMLGKIGFDGEPVAACVDSLAGANAFFGRDLETGAPVNQMPLPLRNEETETAARHGMSVEELRFYKKMIADAMRARPENSTLTIVNADGAGEGFNDPTATTAEGGNTGATRGEQRLILFQFAAQIWGSFLDSNVPVQINSQFNSLTPCTTSGGVLGSAGATTSFRDFSGAPFGGTWYQAALANKLSGLDLNGTATAEINARFNSDVDTGCLGAGSRFYYGLNNTTPGGRVNLLVVLLHEMGHGLGFATISNGQTGALNSGFPDTFLLHIFDRTTGKYWKDMTNAERQVSALNASNVVFDGENLKSASFFLTAGRDPIGRVQLYTPTTFQSGSSISHFDTLDTPNLLMEPNISLNLPLDLDLTKQVMRDIGWFRDENGDNIPDTIDQVTLAGNAVIGSPATVRWRNTGAFDKNVTIELSTDGGATFPTVLATDTTNNSTFTFTVPNTPTTQARIRVRENGFIDPMGTSANFTISTTTAPRRVNFDYDGDGKTDISLFRPSNNSWFIQKSADNSVAITQWGLSGDLTVPADYDGDGKTDIAIWRPSNGVWFWINSATNTLGGNQFGLSSDIPAPADYDGDGKADIMVYRPSGGQWWLYRSSDNAVSVNVFGIAEDKPAAGDFDGDGKADLSVFRPSSATWFHLNSSDGAFVANQFGLTGDQTVAADYDGDGKTDIGIWRPSNGLWFWLRSSDGATGGVLFGLTGDQPTPGDYDGDGKSDPAVFRPSQSTWYMLGSTQGFTAQQFGSAGDVPTPNSFVR